MIIFQFITLHLVLLLVAYYGGKKATIASSNKSYWKALFLTILFFTVEEGFRWVRDIDWCGYYWTYESLGSGNLFKLEPLIYYVWRLFYLMEVPYPYVIAISSFILIFALCFLAKEFKDSVYIFIPLSIIWLSPLASNLFRWYTAFSFDMIGLVFLLNKKYVLFGVMMILAFMTHTVAAALFLPCLFLYVFCKKNVLGPKLVCLISIGLILLANISILSNFMGVFNLFSGFERFAGYLDNANDWFFSTNVKDGIERKSPIVYVFSMLPFYLILLFGEKVGDKIKRYDFYYNVLSFGVLLRSISSGSELVMRIATFYDFAFLIICAVYLASVVKVQNARWVAILLMVSIMYKTYVYVKPYKYDALMYYYWNEHKISPSKAPIYYMQPNYR